MIIKKFKQRKEEHSASKLLLFFAGWGMDERPFLPFLPEDRDVAICYDYRSLDFDYSLVEGYDNIQVVAWSMGVWAAAFVLRDNPFPVTESIAINGTLYPVDDEKGIARRIFQGTLESLSEQSLLKFHRRMCGSAEALQRFLAHAPQRALEELREELRLIGERAEKPLRSAFVWDKAYIGRQDKIFLPVNQERAWEGTPIYWVEGEHLFLMMNCEL